VPDRRAESALSPLILVADIYSEGNRNVEEAEEPGLAN